MYLKTCQFRWNMIFEKPNRSVPVNLQSCDLQAQNDSKIFKNIVKWTFQIEKIGPKATAVSCAQCLMYLNSCQFSKKSYRILPVKLLSKLEIGDLREHTPWLQQTLCGTNLCATFSSSEKVSTSVEHSKPNWLKPPRPFMFLFFFLVVILLSRS